MTAWTDESRAKAIELYQASEPTADSSTEILAEIGKELGQSPNGVRMILTKAGVYVKKTPATKNSTTSTSSGDKAPRVSKEAAHARLNEALQAAGQEANDEIVSKLTGKAALYFADVIEAIT